MDLARARLTEERKSLAAARPVGCWGRPSKHADGSVNLFQWDAGITPAKSSLFALPDGDTYRVQLRFSEDFPKRPPVVTFRPPIFHTNVWPTGVVW